MCLTNVKKIIAPAWKSENGKMVQDWYDITCYKVLLVEGKWPRKKLYSPIWGEFVWKRGKTYSTGVDVPEIEHNFTKDWEEVYGGAFHTFCNLTDAINMANNKTSKHNTYCVYECVIPKDTKFLYEGTIGGSCMAPGYASEKLIVKKPVYQGRRFMRLDFY